LADENDINRRIDQGHGYSGKAIDGGYVKPLLLIAPVQFSSSNASPVPVRLERKQIGTPTECTKRCEI
jgi:hypothetical protein